MNNYEKTVTAMVLKAYALVGQEDKQIQIKETNTDQSIGRSNY
jgi:hypothetical protein